MAEFIPLTARDIVLGRLRSFKITYRPSDSDGADAITVDIAAVSAARALRVLADRLEDENWQGPMWSRSPELTYRKAGA